MGKARNIEKERIKVREQIRNHASDMEYFENFGGHPPSSISALKKREAYLTKELVKLNRGDHDRNES